MSSLSAMFSGLNSNCAMDGLVAFGNNKFELNKRNEYSQSLCKHYREKQDIIPYF